MPLNWNEIKERASQFSKEWETATSEDAEAKSFWDDFFQVFGVSRRRVATFEHKVPRDNHRADFRTKERAIKFLIAGGYSYIVDGIAEIHGIKVCNCGVCDFIIVSDGHGCTFHLRICEKCGEQG